MTKIQPKTHLYIDLLEDGRPPVRRSGKNNRIGAKGEEDPAPPWGSERGQCQVSSLR